MLYFYTSISPHPIENLHNYLHYFFSRLFAEVHPTYVHAYYIDPDFQDIVDEYKVQIDNKLAAIFTGYIGLPTPGEKQAVQYAYYSNNDIEGICNLTITPVKYGELPATMMGPIESLYDNLWGDNKILGYARVVDQCGTLKSHFDTFRIANDYAVCPFCGLSGLLCEHDDGKDDYDHYLPKSLYPFITVNFKNLMPMCHGCNSKAKGQQDTPFDEGTHLQRPLFYPADASTPQNEISLSINAPTTYLGDPNTWSLEFSCAPIANNLKMESWVNVFNIETRYKAILAKESKTWKGWIMKKHKSICKDDKAPYQTFYNSEIKTFEDYLNIDKGILFKTFYEFVLNDPNCESYLTGQGII